MKTTITLNRIFKTFFRLQRSSFSVVFLLLFTLSASSSWGQIAQRGSSTTASSATTNNTTITINKPTGVVAGDVLLFSVVQNETDNDNGGLSSPTLSGWTLVKDQLIRSEGTSNGDNAWFGSIYYRVSDGSEGTSFTFAMNSRCDMAIGSMVAFSGVACNALKPDGSANGPFDITPGSFNNADSSTATATGVTVANNNSAVIMFAMCNNDRSYSSWSNSQSELFDNITTNGDDASVGAAWLSSVNSGSTGNRTVTLSASDRNSAILLVLRRATTMTVGAASSTPTLCINTALTNITHSTSGATGIGTATGLPAGVTAAWASNTITISGTPTNSGNFTYSIPLVGSCAPVDATGTITVTAVNTVGAPSSSPTLCQNTTLTNITHSTSGATGIGSATGLPTGVTALWASNTITISGTPTNSGTFTYSIPLTGGCGSVNATGTITITASPVVTAAANTTTFCGSGTVNLTGTTDITSATSVVADEDFENTSTYTASGGSTKTGTSGSGDRPASASFVVSPTTSYWVNNGTATITTQNFTGLQNGEAKIVTMRLASFSVGSTSNGADATDNVWVDISLDGGSTYSREIEVNGGNSGNTHWGFSTGIGVASVTYDGNNTATIFAPTGSGARTTDGFSLLQITLPTSASQVRVRVRLFNNSGSEAWVIDDIVVSQTITPTYSWTSSPSGFTSNVLSPTSISVSASTNYTLLATDPSTGCFGTGSVAVTVSTNTASAGSSTPTLCANTALTNITHTTTGATGIGTATGLPAGVTAAFAYNTITISGTPTAAGIFNYSIPLTGGCGSVNATGTITINEAPSTTGVSICAGGSDSLSATFSSCPNLTAQTIGPRGATSGTNVTGVGSVAWSNPQNIAVSGSNATRSLSGSQISNYLLGSNFGFNIPLDAIINGITVTITRLGSSTSSGGIRDSEVKLFVDNTIQSTNKAVTGTNWTTSSTNAIYGGSNDLWGSTTLTPSLINQPDFGVVLSARNANTSSSRTATVSQMQITVTYTLPDSLNWYTVSSGGTAIGLGSTFNPVGVAGSGLANTNTPGTTSYWVECTTAVGSCRSQADFVINPSPTVNAGTAFTKTCIANSSGAAIGETAEAGHTYSWSPSTGLSSATASNPTANPTITTTYTVTKTNTATGCTATGTVTVTVNNSAISVNAGTAFTKTCVSNPNGAAIGETNEAGHTYSWSPTTGLSSTTVSNPTANPTTTTTYTVTKTNTATGCIATESVVVTVNNSAISVNAGTGFTKTCVSNASGAAIGETAVAGYTYSWSPATGLTSSTASNPIANPTSTTTYTVTKTNTASGCTATGTVIVTLDNQAPTVTASSNQSVCAGSSVTLSGSGATSYSWNNGISNGVAFTPSATTTYTVTGTDANGCSNSASTTITVNPIITPTFTQVAAICSGATLAALPTTSNNSITGTWSPVINNTATTTYTFTPTGGQCPSTTTMTITVNPVINPSVSIAASATTICSGTSVTFTATPTNGGDSPSYQWKVNGNNVGTNSATYTSTTLANTDEVKVILTVNTTQCLPGSETTSNTVTMTVNPNLAASVSIAASPSAFICIGTSATFTATPTNGGATPSYQWKLNGSNVGTNSATYSSSTIANNDVVSVVMTSTATCVTGSPVTSNVITMTVSPLPCWTGENNTSWNVSANWAQGVIPTDQTAAFISGTAPNQPQVQNGIAYANSIELLNNAVLTIKGNTSLVVTNGITVPSTAQFIVENNANFVQINPNAVNSGSIKVKRNTRGLQRLDYVLWSSPTEGTQTLREFSPETVDNRFYTYNSATNAYTVMSNILVPFQKGKGYLIRTPNNHPTTSTEWSTEFNGVPNNGTVTQQMPSPRAGNQNRYFLVGNPYASGINISSFIQANQANINGIIYIWRKTNGAAISGYGSIIRNPDDSLQFTSNGNGIGGAQNPGSVIPSGQGFIVDMKVGASQVVFTNDMRVNSPPGVFNRTAQVTNNTTASNQFTLKLGRDNGEFTFADVGYFSNASNNYEPTYDVESMSDAALSVASIVENKRIVSQSRAAFDISDVVPLSIIINLAGNYKLSLDNVHGLFADNQVVYLRDNLMNTIHNLTEGSYPFASEIGTFNSRFEIIYQSTTLGVTNPGFNENQVIIYKTPSSELSINTGSVIMSSVKIFDITGKLLFEKKGIDSSQTLLTLGSTTEVLLVQITSSEGVIVTKKVLFPRTSLKLDKKIDIKTQLAEDE